MSEQRSILLVDDEHTLLRLSQIMFQRKGFTVFPALSIKEAKNILEEQKRVDVVVLDLMMPEENGFDFLMWLDEQDDSLKGMNIVVNTAKNLSESEKEFLEKRVLRIMHKGIDFTDSLLSEVEKILR
jgi:DNA-binding NtrC family response regulator